MDGANHVIKQRNRKASMANEFPLFQALLQGNLNANGFTLTGLPSLNFGSTATGLTLFNTADEVTNFERASIKWVSNIFTIDVARGGTGTARNLQLTVSNNAASGTPNLISLLPTLTQSGTAGYTALLLNVTESSVGSGTKTLFDIQVGGTSRFKVTGNGSTTIGDLTSVSQLVSFFQNGLSANGTVPAKLNWLAKDSAAGPVAYAGIQFKILDNTNLASIGQLELVSAHGALQLQVNMRLSGNGRTIWPSGQSLFVYNTADETTNYERAEFKWASNVFTLALEKGGTGVGRKLAITLAGEVSSSGVQNLFSILPTVAQSGTAGYTAFLLNVTESSVGTGDKLIMRWQLGGSDRLLLSAAGQVAIIQNLAVGYAGTVAQLANVSDTLQNTNGTLLTCATGQSAGLHWRRSASAADQKIWSMEIYATNEFRWRLYSDDLTSTGTVLQVFRSGTTPTKLIFPAADFGFGLALSGTPVARLHVLEATLNDPVFALESTTATDPVHEEVRHGRVLTTDATVTSALTLALTASRTYNIHARVYARRTGGAAGVAEDAAGYFIRGTFKVVAGISVLVGALVIDTAAEDQSGWDATLAVVVGTANVSIDVTGAALNNITWHVIASISYVGI